MKKRTGKLISLSLAAAMAVTAAPVSAMAEDGAKTDVIEAPVLTPADETEKPAENTTTEDTTLNDGAEEGTEMAELTPAAPVAVPAVDEAATLGEPVVNAEGITVDGKPVESLEKAFETANSSQ